MEKEKIEQLIASLQLFEQKAVTRFDETLKTKIDIYRDAAKRPDKAAKLEAALTEARRIFSLRFDQALDALRASDHKPMIELLTKYKYYRDIAEMKATTNLTTYHTMMALAEEKGQSLKDIDDDAFFELFNESTLKRGTDLSDTQDDYSDAEGVNTWMTETDLQEWQKILESFGIKMPKGTTPRKMPN